MRSSSSSRYVAAVAATIVGLVLIGCSTDNGDPAEAEEIPAPTTGEKKNASEKEPAPEFDADFEEEEEDPNDGDPTPPDGDQCIDNDDPGSAENVAKVLPPTDDCDNSYKTVNGVASGEVDVDFYKLSMADKTGCLVQADFEGQTAGTELCVYARCKNSTIDAVEGCAQGVLSTSEIGMKGCCAAAPGRAVPKWDCEGFTDNDSADFFFKVRQINGDKCLPYSFRYRF